MLAQLFNPTEIKKNGPATRPAIAPARRSALPFSAALAVLPATSQGYGDARVIVKDHPGDELMFEGAVPDGGIQFARQFGEGFCRGVLIGGRFIGFVLDRVVGGGSADDADAGGPNDARNGPADWRTSRGRLEVR